MKAVGFIKDQNIYIYIKDVIDEENINASKRRRNYWGIMWKWWYEQWIRVPLI